MLSIIRVYNTRHAQQIKSENYNNKTVTTATATATTTLHAPKCWVVFFFRLDCHRKTLIMFKLCTKNEQKLFIWQTKKEPMNRSKSKSIYKYMLKLLLMPIWSDFAAAGKKYFRMLKNGIYCASNFVCVRRTCRPTN